MVSTEPKTVLWVHSFSESVLNSGVFMHEFFQQSRKSELFSNRYKIMTYSFPMNGGPRKLLMRLIELRVKSKQFDIVHVQWGSFLSLLCAISLSRVERQCCLLTLRGSDFYRHKEGGIFKRLHSLLASNFGRLSTRYYGTVLVMSNRMLQDLNRSGWFDNSKTRSVVLPDPIDCNLYSKKANSIVRDGFTELNKRPVRVLFSAVDPTSEIKRRYLAVRAVLGLREKLHDRQVEFVELTSVPHSDISLIIQNVDVVLLTSIHEGWPNIIKETLACGIPFVSTDVSDLSRVEVDSGGLCRVVSGNSDEKLVEELVAALYEVINHRKTDGDELLLKSIVAEFDYSSVLEHLIAIYDSTEARG